MFELKSSDKKSNKNLTNDQEVLVVNLSLLTKLTSIYTEVMPEFIWLCTDSPRSSYLSCCPSSFFYAADMVWVLSQYKKFQHEIDSYKFKFVSGESDTTTFLQKMLNILSFLEKQSYSEQFIAGLFAARHEFYVLHKITDLKELTPKLIAFARLEATWNKLVAAIDEERFSSLLVQAKTKPVYLISNTNELNLYKILTLAMKGALANTNSKQKALQAIIEELQSSQKPVEIAPNLYLYLSYQVKSSKTTGLIDKLYDELATTSDNTIKPNNVTVISQFDGDLNLAKKQGMLFQKGAEFFDMSSPQPLKQKTL